MRRILVFHRPRAVKFPHVPPALKKSLRTTRGVAAIAAGVILLMVVPLVLWQLRSPTQKVAAAWFDANYGYRKLIPLTNSSGTAQTDFQTQITVDTATLITAGKMLSSCADIRLTDYNGKVLPYWIEPNTCNTSTTLIWVKVPSIPTPGADIYLYYGFANGVTASNTATTFIADNAQAAVAWPLDDTTTNQSYSRVTDPAVATGRNMVINGGFDSDTIWTKGTGATIAGGVGVLTAVAAGATAFSQTPSIVAGKAYQTTFTISGFSAGGVSVGFSATTPGTIRTANGTYTETLVADSTTLSVFGRSSATTANVDNVIVTQINVVANTATPIQLLTDGDMEAGTAAAWTAGNSATLSKVAGSAHSGNNVLRVAFNTAANPYAKQNSLLTVGNVYRIYGYTRSDGTTIPRVYAPGGNLSIFAGTTSTIWQPFDVVFVADATNSALLLAFTSGAGFVEFDDVVMSQDIGIRQGEISQDGAMEVWASATDLTNWTEALSGTSTVNKETSVIHGGSFAARLDVDASNSSVAIQQNTLAIGKTYRIGFWAKASTTGKSFGSDFETFIPATGLTTTYTYYEFTGVATSTTLNLKRNTGTSASIYFDDITVTEVDPLVGIPTNGVVLGSSTGAGGHLTNAYTFDGTNDFVNIYSSDLNSDFNPQEGTLVAWAKVASSGVWTDATNRRVVVFDNGGTNTLILCKGAGSNSLTYYYAAGGTINRVDPTGISNTGWMQLVMTWSKSKNEVRAYLNGVQVGTTQTGLGTWATNLPTSSVEIGANDATGANSWSGMINDVRLYTRPLSATEIAAQYNASYDVQAYTSSNYLGHELLRKYNTGVTVGALAAEETPPGPVLYWKLDEGNGQTVHDTTNTVNGTLGANTGVAADDPTWQNEDQCVSGKCLYFNNTTTGQYALLGNVNQAKIDTKTISFWARPTTNITVIQGAMTTNGSNWYAGFDTGGKMIFSYTNTSAVQVAPRSNANVVPANEWHLYTYTVLVSGVNVTVTFYKDGVNVGSSTASSGYSTSAYGTIFKLGNLATTTTNGYTGLLDEPKVYSYVRTQGQIQADYDLGAESLGKKDQTDFLSSGLVGYWKMDEASWDGTSSQVLDSSDVANHGTATGLNGTSSGSNSSTTLNDTAQTWSVNFFTGDVIVTTGGTGSGQTRTISANTATQVTVTAAWGVTPDATTTYRIVPTTTSGKFGSSGLFDGYSGHINTSNASSLVYTGGNLTLSAWVKPNSGDDGGEILSKPWNGSGQYNYYLLSSGGSTPTITLRMDGATSYSLASTGTLTAGSWNLVTVTVGSDQSVRIYLNGVLDKTGVSTVTNWTPGSGDTSQKLAIGCIYPYNGTVCSATTFAYRGQIDEVRVYARTLSAADVQALYNWAPGPTAYYKLDDSTGTSAIDSSGNSNTGTLENGPTWVAGKIGDAVSFDGSNDDINIPSSANNDFDFNRDFTVSAWVKIPSAVQTNVVNTSNDIIVKRGASGSIPYDIQFLNSTQGGGSANKILVQRYDGTNTPNTISTNTYNDNVFHYITFSKNGSLLSLFIDGKLDTTTTDTTTTTTTNASNVFIGKRGDGVLPFTGVVDDVKIYNYARGPSQILDDMGGGPSGGTAGVSVGTLPKPSLYWKFDEGQGTTANSAGINAYSGTLAGTTLPAWKFDGKVNKALFFTARTDTAGSRVTYATGANLSIGTTTGSQLTFSLWMKPNASQTNGSAYFIRNGTTTDTSYAAYLSALSGGSYKLNVVYYDGAAFRTLTSTNTIVPASVWSHVAVVISQGQNVQLYVNGNLRETLAWTGANSVASGTSFNIGSHTGAAAQSYDGYIDEVKVYNTGLTGSQVKLDMNAGASENVGATAPLESSLLSDGTGNPPVAYWNLDEHTGTTANDISGNNNTGTLNNTPAWVTGKIGSGLDFPLSGTTKNVSVAAAASINDLSALTAEAWVYPRSSGTSNIGRIIEKGNDSSSGWVVRAGTGQSIRFVGFFNGGTNLAAETAAGAMPLNTWSHVAVSWDGSLTAANVKIYVNGVLQTLSTATNGVGTRTSEGVNGLYIGNFSTSSENWDGKLDEIKLYNYVRTAPQVAYDYNRAGPVAWYKLDECQGTTLNDASGNANPATFTAGAGGTTNPGTCNTSSTSWGNGVVGKYNASLSFDGTDDSASFTRSSAIQNIATQGTISVWAKYTTNDGTLRTLVDIAGTGNNGLILLAQHTSCSGNKIGVQYGPGSTPVIACSTTLPVTGVWYHIVTTWNSAGAKLYINGVLEGTNATAPAITIGAGTAYIGSNAGVQRYFNGQIDDVQIYNYALSVAQIQKLYNQNAGIRFGPVTGSP